MYMHEFTHCVFPSFCHCSMYGTRKVALDKRVLSGGGGVGSICMIGKKGKDRSQAMILVWARAFLNGSTLGEGMKDIFCMTSGSLSPILILRRSCSVGPSVKASPKLF